MGNNITSSITCKYWIAANLRSRVQKFPASFGPYYIHPINMVCFTYVIVNILQKVIISNNNNNNNNRIDKTRRVLASAIVFRRFSWSFPPLLKFLAQTFASPPYTQSERHNCGCPARLWPQDSANRSRSFIQPHSSLQNDPTSPYLHYSSWYLHLALLKDCLMYNLYIKHIP